MRRLRNDSVMNSREDFIIDKAYSLLPEDKQTIAKVIGKGHLSTNSWSDKELDTFKENIRDYLREKQNGYCAFCRMKMHEENATAELEHIVNKGSRLDWMFFPQNLILSCKLCNTSKSTNKSLKDMSVPDYPKDGGSFLFVNPYFDRYSEHIEIKNGILYHGITPKGIYTVDKCHLNRMNLTIARAENVIKNSKNGFIGVFLMINNPMYAKVVEDKDKIIKRLHLKERMQQYKAKHKQ